MKQRSVFLGVILSFLTCGIYATVWIWILNNELRVANGKNKNSVINFILSIVTCGIFYLVWNYKLGEEVEDFGGKDDGVLYLFLAFFSFGIISIALAQSQVNEICERKGIS